MLYTNTHNHACKHLRHTKCSLGLRKHVNCVQALVIANANTHKKTDYIHTCTQKHSDLKKLYVDSIYIYMMMMINT